MRVGVAVVDLFTGMYTATAILAALVPPRADRRGRAHRHGAVRHAAGGARQPGVQCAGLGQGPAAAGQYPSQYRAVPAVRRPPISRSSSRSATTASSRGSRRSAAIRNGRATSASRRTARGSPTARRWFALIARLHPPEAGRRMARAARSRRHSGRADQHDQPGACRRPGAASPDGPDDRRECRWWARPSASTASARMPTCRRPRSASIRLRFLRSWVSARTKFRNCKRPPSSASRRCVPRRSAT